MVRTNGAGYELCSWQKDSPQGSQDPKYFPFIQGRYQDWRFRYCKSTSTYLWLCQYCHWNAILSFTWNLPVKTLQPKIWYLESGMHFLWNCDTKPCIWCSKYEGPCAKNLERNLPSFAWCLQFWLEKALVGNVDKGPKQTPINPKNFGNAFHEGQSQLTVFQHNKNPRTETSKIEHFEQVRFIQEYREPKATTWAQEAITRL